MRRKGLVIASILVAAAIGLGATHDVSRAVTPEDSAAASALLRAGSLPTKRPAAFRDQLKLILAVQDRILTAAPVDEAIPEGEPRELADLIRARKGLCFDRSRAIETVLRSRGFETRHAAIYSTAKTGSALRSLATPQTESHAVTEVMTARGWLLVDSNQRWIGLTADGQPIDLGELQAQPNRRWHPVVQTPLPPIYAAGPFTYVYGLYSRHGRFYPPYNVVPDVNWAELAENL